MNQRALLIRHLEPEFLFGYPLEHLKCEKASKKRMTDLLTFIKHVFLVSEPNRIEYIKRMLFSIKRRYLTYNV